MYNGKTRCLQMGSTRVRWETLPPCRREVLVEDLQKGYSLFYLEQKHQISRAALGRWVEVYELARGSERTTGIEKLVELKEFVLSDYLEEGVGMRELKFRFGVHEGTMRTFLQMQGVLKGRGGQQGALNPQSKGRQVEIADRDSGKYWARRAVELTLGQKLPTGWVIHHMNECPTDQTMGNLWLFRGANQHSLFHQRQRENLTAGGQLPASRLAKDNGGLWLPEILDRLGCEPDTELRSL